MSAKSTQPYSSPNPIPQTTPVETKADDAHANNTGSAQGRWNDHTTRAKEVRIDSGVPTDAEIPQARSEQKPKGAVENLVRSSITDGNDADNGPFRAGLQNVARRIPPSAPDSAGVMSMQQRIDDASPNPRVARATLSLGMSLTQVGTVRLIQLCVTPPTAPST
ncbi:hypothetical protein [Hydrogenophaga sp. BPS33]|uniref:hypothetical protein n=1 Tax=Hydrogenophaga sp. BPS33 TaxID=2651974 RepID=UPI00131F8AEA|nr:hypothetical protein [Hydrogenophaga sp. BPS33]QHE87600.1 hypothetical protein F9K07_23230 [Hydrogenophaga sp. BPS33]